MKRKFRLPTHVAPQRYEIMLKPNFEDFTFYGEESIFLKLDKPTNKITLHAADLEISSVDFTHRGTKNIKGKISYDKKAETATFAFAKNLPKGNGELKLTFKGILNDKMRGFYRSKFEHDGEEKHLATTQFESTDARRAFPCFDEPAQKAIFDVTLMVPSSTTAISNTIESDIKEHEAGYKIVKFEPTPKMSTYLLAFIVGEFEYIEGKTKNNVVVRVFTTPGKKHQAKFALNVGIKCLEFYENYFKIKYPLSVLDMIAIPDFAAGAMENWGAVTYRESTLLVDEQISSSGNKQWVAMVIAHELAHQWFGNLVTMEWWTHLWLNEGFASFIEYLAIDSIFPQWDIWTQFVANEMGVAYQLDSLKNTHPIEVEVGHPAEISEIFDKVSYSKGASILRMLHEYLGPKDFQKGLQHYLEKHAYSNAKTEDLWLALEEISGKTVTEVMKNWTSKPGHPVISVKFPSARAQGEGKVKSSKLELTQSRFFASPISKKATKDSTIWAIPLKTQNSKRKTQNYMLNLKTTYVPKPKDEGWFKLNADEGSFVRIDYPYGHLKKLEAAIKNKKLSAVDRLGLIRDSFALSQSGDSPTTLALEFSLGYINEEDYTVWAELIGQINQLDSLLVYESFYLQFKSYGKVLFGKIAQKMGWEKKKEESHTDALLRGMVLNAMGGFGDLETIEKAKELFALRKIDADLRGVVYNLVAENGGDLEFNTLIAMYKKEENQQEKERIGRSLGKFKQKNLLNGALEFSISKHVRFQNTLGIIASVWSNPAGRYLAWDFVKKKWRLLKERYAGGHYFTRVFGPAGQFSKKEDAKDIENFVKKNPVPEAQRTIAQAIEQIYLRKVWLDRDKKQIKTFLAKYP